MLDSGDVRLLTEIGFLAMRYGRCEEARSIFSAVKALRPDQDAGHIGTALIDMLEGDLDTAIAALEKLPTSDAARAFLGMALLKQGAAAEAQSVLLDVAGSAPDTAHGVLATEILKQLAKG
jgi:predicted Zn-dependent protease